MSLEYLRPRPNPDSPVSWERQAIGGGHEVFSLFPSKRFEWMADFGRSSATFSIPKPLELPRPAGHDSFDSRQWTLTAGPRVRVFDAGWLRLWAHGLFGISQNVSYELPGLAEQNTVSPPIAKKQFGFASIVGTSAEVDFTNRFTSRTDLSWVNSPEPNQKRNRVRFLTGLDIKLSSR